MRYVEDVPSTVAINEALEIAKHYAEPESVGFINGILDGIEI
jgi:N utilization substance protein B